MKIEIGARVRTRHGRDVGHVHRVLVDLDDNSVTGIVVLKGHLLSRDVLVPLDFIERAVGDEVVLTLDENELFPSGREKDSASTTSTSPVVRECTRLMVTSGAWTRSSSIR